MKLTNQTYYTITLFETNVTVAHNDTKGVLCVYVCVCVCICVFVYMCISACMCVCVCMYVCVHVCTCIVSI